MRVQNVSQMFNFTYEKSSKDIVEAAKKKVTKIRAKIEERETRIKKVRAEFSITDAVWADILQQTRKQANNNNAMYTYSNAQATVAGHVTEDTVTIGAGTVNNLISEYDFIDGEKSQARKLELVIRNLQDLPDGHGNVRGHKLDNEELEFLGF